MMAVALDTNLIILFLITMVFLKYRIADVGIMTYFNQYQLLAYMMRNYNLALELTEAASGKSKEFYSKAH